MGISENYPLHIGTFLRETAGDPAVKVWTAKTVILCQLINIRLL
jgi:hypothetical protein